MKQVKICVDILLKDVPRNCIFINVPEGVNNSEEYCINLVRDHINNSKIIVTSNGENYEIPKQLISNINIYPA